MSEMYEIVIPVDNFIEASKLYQALDTILNCAWLSVTVRKVNPDARPVADESE